jgi:Trypsin
VVFLIFFVIYFKGLKNMRIPLLISIMSSFIIISCKDESKKPNNQVCKTLPDSFKSNKMAHGCDELSGDIPGEKSTVFVWTGNGGCTGTVISEHFILTAAHCFYDHGSDTYSDPAQARIVLGNNAYDLLNAKSVKVARFFVNPLYTNNAYVGNFLSMGRSHLGDIALVQTEGNLIKDYGLVASKTTLRDARPTEEILSIGYGSTGKYDYNTGGLKRWSVSGVGQVIKDPIYDAFQAEYDKAGILKYVNKTYALLSESSFLVTERKAEYHGQTCYGDSGGPQFVKRNGETVVISATQGGTPLLQGPEAAGIFASGADDCNKLSTSLNTRVAPYFDWINTQMSSYGEHLVSVDKL